MKHRINQVIYSFPVQLFFLHLRNNQLPLVVWVLAVALITGKIGKRLGIHYLFLVPEYLGEVNFWSFFFVGTSFGAFLMTWNLTTYLLGAHYFPFLASLARPFTKFCLNNSLIPLAFVIFYLFYDINFQLHHELWPVERVVHNFLGFIIGLIFFLLGASLYFYYTNKDILSFLRITEQHAPNIANLPGPGQRSVSSTPVIHKENKWRVDTYLSESLRPRIVRSVAHYDTAVLLRVFRQNHLNALIVQLFSLVILIVLGYLIENPYFRIPVAASAFILASMLVSISGALAYWFGEWSLTVFILLLISINYMTSFELFNHKNKCYGMNYTVPPAKYSYKKLEESCQPDIIAQDKANTIEILEKWKSRVQPLPSGKKPKMIIIGVSGGGLKASVWTMQVIQRTDSLLNQNLLKNTVLITGASGGLLGTAYLRELLLRKRTGQPVNLYDRQYIENISQDLLNPIFFTIISNDLFLPWVKFETGGQIYRKDRGYIFEKQLNENTGYVFEKTLKDYKQPETDALIPMIFITPAIVNDGRRLIISPQGVSYMTVSPLGLQDSYAVEIDAVDFGAFFKEQGASDMLFTSALRMNASYPFILPSVTLPSSPRTTVVDAGFRDNQGIISTTRFIQVFKDWILENTSGVVLVQISGSEKIEAISPNDKQGIIESIFNPLGIVGQILSLQDYEHDTNLGLVYDLMGKGKFEIIRFIYQSDENNEKASMSFHLTNREKIDILNAYYREENQRSLKRLQQIFADPILTVQD